MKIITICGSLKFIEEMKFYTEKLALAGNCVLSVIYPIKNVIHLKKYIFWEKGIVKK